MREIVVHPFCGELDAIDKYEGAVPTENDYDEVIESPVKVTDDKGNIVCIIVPDGTKSTKAAYEVLKGAAQLTRNRQVAAKGETSFIKKKDGTMSNTTQLPTHLAPMSSIIGYYDRYARTPYARACRWNRENPDQWRQLWPFIHSVSECFREYAPEKWMTQKKISEQIPRDWIIGDTPFSTITVNKSFSIHYHRDRGDLHEGLGVMAHLSVGNYLGGELVIPRFRKALRFKNRDIILFDVHQVHGVMPLHGAWGRFVRMTAVFYLRENLLRCGDVAYEVKRAKIARQLGRLYDPDEIQMAQIRKDRGIALAKEAMNACAA